MPHHDRSDDPTPIVGPQAARSRRRRLSRWALPLVGAWALVVISAVPASAHVRVTAIGATQGGFSELGFRVPTESDTASTTKLAVYFPTDTPLAFVSVKPHTGWTYQITRAQLDTPITAFGETVTETVSRITWTASSAATAIKPGEYDTFEVFGGPLPEADSISFKAVQTYSDDTVVRWIEPTPASGEEPEHPAPTLELLPAVDAGDSGTATSPSASASASTDATTADVTTVGQDTDSGGGSSLSLGISLVALVAALGAGSLALAARRRTRD